MLEQKDKHLDILLSINLTNLHTVGNQTTYGKLNRSETNIL